MCGHIKRFDTRTEKKNKLIDTVVDGESNRDVYDNGIDALVR